MLRAPSRRRTTSQTSLVPVSTPLAQLFPPRIQHFRLEVPFHRVFPFFFVRAVILGPAAPAGRVPRSRFDVLSFRPAPSHCSLVFQPSPPSPSILLRLSPNGERSRLSSAHVLPALSTGEASPRSFQGEERPPRLFDGSRDRALPTAQSERPLEKSSPSTEFSNSTYHDQT